MSVGPAVSRTRSPAVLTGTPSPSLGRSRNPSRSSPLSAQVLSPHAPRSLTCPTPAAPPLPTPSPRRLGTCWQVKSGKGRVTRRGRGRGDGEPVGTEAFGVSPFLLRSPHASCPVGAGLGVGKWGLRVGVGVCVEIWCEDGGDHLVGYTNAIRTILYTS